MMWLHCIKNVTIKLQLPLVCIHPSCDISSDVKMWVCLKWRFVVFRRVDLPKSMCPVNICFDETGYVCFVVTNSITCILWGVLSGWHFKDVKILEENSIVCFFFFYYYFISESQIISSFFRCAGEIIVFLRCRGRDTRWFDWDIFLICCLIVVLDCFIVWKVISWYEWWEENKLEHRGGFCGNVEELSYEKVYSWKLVGLFGNNVLEVEVVDEDDDE